MNTKLDQLRRIVSKLVSRYGTNDEDVLRLQSELHALECAIEPPLIERRAKPSRRFNFETAAKQHYRASTSL
jgi:hypothetical protein